ncbi:MAG: sigma 54-interacting transcriptional regulator [Candidatus Zixiibacteriota bacterium]
MMKSSNSHGFIESLIHYMAGLLDKREFASAIRQFELNRELVDEVGGTSAASVLHLAAQAYSGVEDLAAALRAARKAQALASEGGDSPLLAEVFVTVGNVLRKMGELREAEKAFRDAESIFRRNDDADGQSRALNSLAGLFFRRNDYRNALSILIEAMEIARRLGDNRKLAFMMGNIGRIYTFLGDMAQAEKHLRINIDLSGELGDSLEVARAYLSLGYLYLQQAEYVKAEETFSRALPLIESMQSRRDEAIYLTYMGELLYRTARFDEARQTLEKAVSLAEEIGPETALVGRAMRHLAELSVLEKNFRQAARLVHRALAIFEKVEDKVEAGALWKLRAMIAEASGKAAEGTADFKRALDLLAESGVRFEKADALVAAGCSTLFPVRERMTLLFRAEEFYSRSSMPIRQEYVARLIGNLEIESSPSTPHLRESSPNSGETQYITANAQIKKFLGQLSILARTDLPILLTGETGVGKDHLARHFHAVVRPGTPYRAINCASLPETLLESELFGYRRGAFTGADSHKPGLLVSANGGVVLLDEIGDMPLSLQVKLLDVLEKRKLTPLGSTVEVPLDIRLVAATNRNLEEMVEQGTFRRDLYYRLSGISFHIPPLRDRKEDIPLLLEQFMIRRGMLAEGKRLPIELVRQFVEYDWPGNIRELDNTVKRLEVMAQMVAEGDLVELARSIFPADAVVSIKGTLFERVLEFERRIIMEAFQSAGGNKSETARILGVHEATVRMKLKRYGIGGSTGALN